MTTERKRLCEKAWKVARAAFKLEVYVENGKRIMLSERLRGYIIETIAIAWLVGYEAGERAAKRKAKP